MTRTDERYIEVLSRHMASLLPLFEDRSIADIERNPNGRIFLHHVDGSVTERSDISIEDRSIIAVGTLLEKSISESISTLPETGHSLSCAVHRLLYSPCHIT